MSEIAVINAVATISPSLSKTGRLALATAAPAQVDQLELSDVGKLLAKLPESTPPRAEKIAQIQRQILDGTYETPERINHTVDQLMTVLGLD